MRNAQWTRRAILAGAACAAVTAASAEDQAQSNARLAREHLDRRLPEIRAALAEAKPGFVFLAGNSHAEIVAPALARGFSFRSLPAPPPQRLAAGSRCPAGPAACAAPSMSAHRSPSATRIGPPQACCR